MIYLTSTQQSSQNFIHPKRTNRSISNEVKFSAALPNNVEIFIFGEKAICIDDKLMDENEINSLIQVCKLLKYTFCGVFATDNFRFKTDSFLWMYPALILLDNNGTFCVGSMAITFLLIRLDRN